MNNCQFLEIITHALPGCHVEQIQLNDQVARVRWAGQLFDISGGTLDGFPLWLVTTPDFTLNESTGKVLDMLESVSEEFVCEEKPWADTQELLRRLRELEEEEDDAA